MRVTKSKAFWPSQVRRLLDSGWTVEELARALQKTPERIRQYASGKAVPEPIARRDLLRMVMRYLEGPEREGKPPLPPPRIVTNNPIAPATISPDHWQARGVYEEKVATPGERWFKVVLSNGKVGLVHLPEELVDPQFTENLWRRLDAKDPVKALKAI